MVTLDFLAGGGDNFWEPREEYAALDLQDVVLTNYVVSESPINIELAGRIRAVNGSASNSTIGGGNGTPGGASGDGSSPSAASASLPFLSSVVGAVLLVSFWTVFSTL
jgi:5'-nucleotidase